MPSKNSEYGLLGHTSLNFLTLSFFNTFTYTFSHLYKATYNWGIHEVIHLKEVNRQRKCS